MKGCAANKLPQNYNVTLYCIDHFLEGYKAVGCFKDSSSRAIPTMEGKDSILDGSHRRQKNTISKGALAAIRAGYQMFAVQSGGLCASSATAPQTFDKYGESSIRRGNFPFRKRSLPFLRHLENC